MTTTEIATKDQADKALVAASDEAAAAVAASQAQEFDDDLLSTPILKVGQALTKEVTEGDAEAGEFINTLTNEGLGDKIEFIVSYYNKGRFATDEETERPFVAFTPDIPDTWEPLVGPEFVGKPFSEYPEAEEQFKASVNAKEREWGHGPLVSTTHNFTGYVLAEGENGETDYQPVRLSLKRTDVPAARKITTLQRAVLRNKPAWDVVLSLATNKKTFSGKTSFVIDPTKIKVARKTTPDEKQLGSELAIAVMNGRTQTEGAGEALEDRATEPAADGALPV